MFGIIILGCDKINKALISVAELYFTILFYFKIQNMYEFMYNINYCTIYIIYYYYFFFFLGFRPNYL